MLIVADENIPLLEPFFADFGELRRVHGRHLQAADVKEADVLLVRSITPVNEALLAGSRVRFVASATIGTDHVDLPYLHQQGICFANAPGCNADSVADYVISALYNLCSIHQQSLRDKTLGIVGVGNVGSRVQQRLQQLGVNILCCDPPREEIEGPLEGFTDLDTLVANADVICLHTPLTKTGSHPSYHLFDQKRLATLASGHWLINAGRGGVIDNQGLKQVLQRDGLQLEVVLDVWENEPTIDPDLFKLVRWGTPHIAGYSLEGRCRGTEMIYQAFCRYLGMAASTTLDALLPSPAIRRVVVDNVDQHLPTRLVNLVYDLRDDHYRLQQTLAQSEKQRGLAFDRLRRKYPPRRQLATLEVAVDQGAGSLGAGLQAELSGLGLRSRL